MKGLDCLQLLIDGEQEGLACLYKLFAEDLYRYGLVISGNAHEVDECIHDFFIYIWEKRKKFVDVQNPKSYLMISFKRRLIKQLKKRNDFEALDLNYESIQKEDSAETQIIENEESDTIAKKLKLAMNQLSSREKEIVHLKYFEKYTNEEIAELLKINNQSVRNVLYRAIKNLRQNL